MSVDVSMAQVTGRGAYARWCPHQVSAEDLFGEGGLGGWPGRTFLLTNGVASVGQVLCTIIDAAAPCDVDLMTWTIGGIDAELLRLRKADGRLRSIRVVLDRFADARSDTRKLRCSWLEQSFGADAFRVTNNHSKCAAIFGSGRTIAMQSSGNLNANPRCEQIDVSDSPEICGMISALVSDVFRTHPAGFTFGADGARAFGQLMTGNDLERMIHDGGRDMPATAARQGRSGRSGIGAAKRAARMAGFRLP